MYRLPAKCSQSSFPCRFCMALPWPFSPALFVLLSPPAKSGRPSPVNLFAMHLSSSPPRHEYVARNGNRYSPNRSSIASSLQTSTNTISPTGTNNHSYNSHGRTTSTSSLVPTPTERIQANPHWNALLIQSGTHEDDEEDWLHDLRPGEKVDEVGDGRRGGTIFTSRGITNVGCMVLLVVALLTLLYVEVFILLLCFSL